MDGFSTITQKGQFTIPKQIRDQLNLKPFDRVHFTLQEGKIITEPVFGIDDMVGIISAKRKQSKKEYKEVIKKHVIKKYASRS